MISQIKHTPLFRFIAITVIVAFVSLIPAQTGYAQVVMQMPAPGQMVHRTGSFEPAQMAGMRIDLKDPFKFYFIMDQGQKPMADDVKKEEYQKLIKYFLASLTISNDDMWVNLSPHESNRIIPDNFAQTGMGRDLLAQDYILKQFTASLMYPEDQLGRDFWSKIYAQVYERYGTTEIPTDTFNKVWITADQADIYQKDDTAFLVKSHLKVMMEQDFMALEKNKQQFGTDQNSDQVETGDARKIASDIMREVIIPVIEKEVNEGENFAQVRQIYSSMIMATWFKKTLKESLLGQVYANKDKVAGIQVDDPKAKEKIYQQYLQAYKVGVFNYIKEEVDPATQETLPRKYFSGGARAVLPETLRNVGLPEVRKERPGLVNGAQKYVVAVASLALALLGGKTALANAQALPDSLPSLENIGSNMREYLGDGAWVNAHSMDTYKDQYKQAVQFAAKNPTVVDANDCQKRIDAGKRLINGMLAGSMPLEEGKSLVESVAGVAGAVQGYQDVKDRLVNKPADTTPSLEVIRTRVSDVIATGEKPDDVSVEDYKGEFEKAVKYVADYPQVTDDQIGNKMIGAGNKMIEVLRDGTMPPSEGKTVGQEIAAITGAQDGYRAGLERRKQLRVNEVLHPSLPGRPSWHPVTHYTWGHLHWAVVSGGVFNRGQNAYNAGHKQTMEAIRKGKLSVADMLSILSRPTAPYFNTLSQLNQDPDHLTSEQKKLLNNTTEEFGDVTGQMTAVEEHLRTIWDAHYAQSVDSLRSQSLGVSELVGRLAEMNKKVPADVVDAQKLDAEKEALKGALENARFQMRAQREAQLQAQRDSSSAQRLQGIGAAPSDSVARSMLTTTFTTAAGVRYVVTDDLVRSFHDGFVSNAERLSHAPVNPEALGKGIGELDGQIRELVVLLPEIEQKNGISAVARAERVIADLSGEIAAAKAALSSANKTQQGLPGAGDKAAVSEFLKGLRIPTAITLALSAWLLSSSLPAAAFAQQTFVPPSDTTFAVGQTLVAPDTTAAARDSISEEIRQAVLDAANRVTVGSLDSLRVRPFIAGPPENNPDLIPSRPIRFNDDEFRKKKLINDIVRSADEEMTADLDLRDQRAAESGRLAAVRDTSTEAAKVGRSVKGHLHDRDRTLQRLRRELPHGSEMYIIAVYHLMTPEEMKKFAADSTAAAAKHDSLKAAQQAVRDSVIAHRESMRRLAEAKASEKHIHWFVALVMGASVAVAGFLALKDARAENAKRKLQELAANASDRVARRQQDVVVTGKVVDSARNDLQATTQELGAIDESLRAGNVTFRERVAAAEKLYGGADRNDLFKEGWRETISIKKAPLAFIPLQASIANYYTTLYNTTVRGLYEPGIRRVFLYTLRTWLAVVGTFATAPKTPSFIAFTGGDVFGSIWDKLLADDRIVALLALQHMDHDIFLDTGEVHSPHPQGLAPEAREDHPVVVKFNELMREQPKRARAAMGEVVSSLREKRDATKLEVDQRVILENGKPESAYLQALKDKAKSAKTEWDRAVYVFEAMPDLAAAPAEPSTDNASSFTAEQRGTVSSVIAAIPKALVKAFGKDEVGEEVILQAVTESGLADGAVREVARMSAQDRLAILANIIEQKQGNAELLATLKARQAEISEVGGINLSDEHLTINIKVDGQGMPLPAKFQDPAMSNIQGLSPIIREIAPMTALNMPAVSELLQMAK